MSKQIPLLVAEQREDGTWKHPDGYVSMSAHVTEYAARKAAAAQSEAAAILRYITASNRYRYHVLKVDTFKKDVD